MRWLLKLYPKPWRARYGEELDALLQARSKTPRIVLDLIRCALIERLCAVGELGMSKFQHALGLMVYAYLAAIAAGINLYWTVDDTPLVAATNGHLALSICWRILAWGSVLALAAATAAALPVAWAMCRYAYTRGRWDIAARLAFPPCAGLVLIAWIAAGATWSGGHWAPLPWDIAGDWPVPANWPPSQTRWVLGSVTFVLMVAALAGSAVAITQAIDRSELGHRHLTTFTKLPTVVLAGSIVLMAGGVLGWGLFANQYAPAVFHARFGGLFGSTSFVSWVTSLTLFIAAAGTALRGARSAIASGAD
jgi:hypothetical protein